MKLIDHGSNVIRPLTRWLAITAVVAAVAALTWAQGPAKPTGAEDVLQPGSPLLIQPAQLLQEMKSPNADKPVVLYTGPKAFYIQAHIPGTDYIGPVNKPEGIETLRSRVASIPRNANIVIYCGCCPWSHCPNIRPAFAELKKEGFTRVRVLYLPTSFGVDWKEKGLPVATGE